MLFKSDLSLQRHLRIYFCQFFLFRQNKKVAIKSNIFQKMKVKS